MCLFFAHLQPQGAPQGFILKMSKSTPIPIPVLIIFFPTTLSTRQSKTPGVWGNERDVFLCGVFRGRSPLLWRAFLDLDTTFDGARALADEAVVKEYHYWKLGGRVGGLEGVGQMGGIPPQNLNTTTQRTREICSVYLDYYHSDYYDRPG